MQGQKVTITALTEGILQDHLGKTVEIKARLYFRDGSYWLSDQNLTQCTETKLIQLNSPFGYELFAPINFNKGTHRPFSTSQTVVITGQLVRKHMQDTSFMLTHITRVETFLEFRPELIPYTKAKFYKVETQVTYGKFPLNRSFKNAQVRHKIQLLSQQVDENVIVAQDEKLSGDVLGQFIKITGHLYRYGHVVNRETYFMLHGYFYDQVLFVLELDFPNLFEVLLDSVSLYHGGDRHFPHDFTFVGRMDKSDDAFMGATLSDIRTLIVEETSLSHDPSIAIEE